MNLTATIFGENIHLIQLQDFSENYTLNVKNTFKMGIENPEINLETISDITLSQIIHQKNIENTIILNNISGKTESHIMQPFLEQSLVLAEISKNLGLIRNRKGNIISIDNKKLWQDWRQWKLKRLKDVFPEEKDQLKFVNNYEQGIEKFEDSLKENLQYTLILPEIYDVVFPPNQQYSYLFSLKKFKSRLIQDAVYEYQMKLVKLEEIKDELDVVLHAQFVNEEFIRTNYLRKIYNSTTDFTIEDYSFEIVINYKLQKSTGKILYGELKLIERLHENLNYTINMTLDQIMQNNF